MSRSGIEELKMSEHVRVTRNGGVLEVIIDKPKANAIDMKVSRALGEAFVTLRDDPELSVGIITGSGERIFCAGWDLKYASALEGQSNPLGNFDFPEGKGEAPRGPMGPKLRHRRKDVLHLSGQG